MASFTQKNWENDGQLQNPRKKKLNTRKRFLKYHISLIPWFPRAYFYIAWVSRGVLLYFLAGYKIVLFFSHPGHCISPQGAREGGGQGVQLICPRLYIDRYVCIYICTCIYTRQAQSRAHSSPGFQGPWLPGALASRESLIKSPGFQGIIKFTLLHSLNSRVIKNLTQKGALVQRRCQDLSG